MGHDRGWHYGQAHDMVREMHRHYQGGYGGGYNPLNDVIGGFINSFAQPIGANVADKVTGGGADQHVIVESST
jgi:hypothetical protein